MVSDERVVKIDQWHHRRRKEIGGRRMYGGIVPTATPFMERKLDSADRNCGVGGGAAAVISARKLAASLWHLSATNNSNGSVTWQSGLLDRLRYEIPKFTTEEAAKWDYYNSKARYDVGYYHTNLKIVDSVKARKRVNELDYEKMRSNEQRASRMRTKHKKNEKKIDILNSKLMRDIAKAKLSAKKFMINLGKEKKARECLEDLCKKLAKEIEGYKAEIGALRSQQENILEEVEKERKSMRIAEVLKEEQARMKLVDVKLNLENKFAEMNNVIAECKVFSKSGLENLARAEICSSHRNKHGSKKSESSEISSVSLNQSEKKGTFGSNKLQISNRADKGEVKIRTNPHVVRAMKGHIEWPRGIKRRGAAEAELLEAKLESQKIIVRNVLKQRS